MRENLDAVVSRSVSDGNLDAALARVSSIVSQEGNASTVKQFEDAMKLEYTNQSLRMFMQLQKIKKSVGLPEVPWKEKEKGPSKGDKTVAGPSSHPFSR